MAEKPLMEPEFWVTPPPGLCVEINGCIFPAREMTSSLAVARVDLGDDFISPSPVARIAMSSPSESQSMRHARYEFAQDRLDFRVKCRALLFFNVQNAS